MDESFWINVDQARALKLYGDSYMISKTLTEKAVLESSEKLGLEVVAGPFICPKILASVKDLLAIVFGMSIWTSIRL